MTLTSTLIPAASAFVSAVSFAQVVRGVFSLSALVGFVMFFRPLLVGIARALVLTVRPRLSKEQLAARRNLRNSNVLHCVINSSSSPVDAAEPRAMASRG